MSIADFFCGALAVNSLLLLWFVSPLKLTLAKLLFNQNFITHDQFDTYILIRYPTFGKLTSCWICLSFWLSLAIGGAFVLWFDAPLLTPIVTFLVYPAICYLFKQIAHIN